jgi:hypothetical protein
MLSHIRHIVLFLVFMTFIRIHSEDLATKELILKASTEWCQKNKISQESISSNNLKGASIKYSEGVWVRSFPGGLFISNGKIAIVLGDEKRMFAILDIIDLRNRHSFVQSPVTDNLLWELTFREASVPSLREEYAGRDWFVRIIKMGAKGETLKNTDMKECSWKFEKGIVILQWHDKNRAHQTLPTVTASISLDGEFSRWKMGIDNIPKGLALWSIRFPQIKNVGKKVLVFDSSWGNIQSHYNQQGFYPAWYWPVQFLALFDSGKSMLYSACEDSEAKIKGYDLQLGESLSFLHYPEKMCEHIDKYDLSYDIVLGAPQGDWYDACKIYRKWVLKQFWCQKGPLSARKDYPSWITQIDFWQNHLTSPEDLLKMKKYFGAHIIAQYLQCFSANLKRDGYPMVFPMQHEHDRSMKGIGASENVFHVPRVVPDLCGLNLPGASDCIKEWAVRDDLGRMRREEWAAGSTANICPYSVDNWHKEKIYETILRLVKEYEIKAIHFDGFTSPLPEICFNPNHGHALGAGNWCMKSRIRYFENVKERILKDSGINLVVDTEDWVEPYIGIVNTYDAIWKRYPEDVPAMAAIYHDYLITYGTCCLPSEGEVPFVSKWARDYLWGLQLGWEIYAKDIENPEYQTQFMFLKALIERRKTAHEFLTYGEMLRPLDLKGDFPSIKTTWLTKHLLKETAMVQLPSVMNSVWKAPDGKLGIILVNIDTVPHKVEFQLNAGLLSETLANTDLSASKIGMGNQAKELGKFINGQKTVIEIPARNSVIFKIGKKTKNMTKNIK